MSSSVVEELAVLLDSSVSSSTLTLSASALSDEDDDDDELSAAVVPFTVAVAFYNIFVCLVIKINLDARECVITFSAAGGTGLGFFANRSYRMPTCFNCRGTSALSK